MEAHGDRPGRACRLPSCLDLPVCSSHLRAWACANPREFATLRGAVIDRASAKFGTGSIRIRVGRRPSKPTTYTWIEFDPDLAQVIADQLADMGYREPCESIMRAVHRLRPPKSIGAGVQVGMFGE